MTPAHRRIAGASSDVLLLVRARVWMAFNAQILADFEIETIEAAWDRVTSGLGGLTAAERNLIVDAVAAMTRVGLEAA